MLRKFAPGGLVKLSVSKHPPKVYFHFSNFNNIIILSLTDTKTHTYALLTTVREENYYQSGAGNTE